MIEMMGCGMRNVSLVQFDGRGVRVMFKSRRGEGLTEQYGLWSL